jgi:S-adenosylmethionine uptake transporter
MILLVNAPFAQWDMILPYPKEYDPLKFLALGFFILIGHIGVPVAYAKAPETSLVAPVFYTQMLWAILYGFIFFDRLPTWMTAGGATLIITGGLYMLLRERHSRRSSLRDMPIEIE